MSQPVLSKWSLPIKVWRTRWGKALFALVLVLVLYSLMGGEKQKVSTNTLFEAKRGNLAINVLEGGNVEARESQTIKSQIKGETKILSIVDEGYLVTPQDVAEKKVLVTLDNSDLIEKMTQETIQYESARADYAESMAQYEITVKQNESDIKKAELDAKFALMDFQKYLGDDVAKKIIAQRGLSDNVSNVTESIRKAVEESSLIKEPVPMDARKEDAQKQEDPATPSPAGDAKADDKGISVPPTTEQKELPTAQKNEQQPNAGEKSAEGKPAGKRRGKRAQAAEDASAGGDLPAEAEAEVNNAAKVTMSTMAMNDKQPEVDFSKFARPDALGDGAAQQQLRKLESDRLLSEGDLGLAQTKLVGTRKLAEKNFVTKQELDNDEMSVKKSTVSKDSAMTAQELFVKYEFPKEAERLLSAYEEAIRAMERTMKQAIAKQAQAEARRKSSEASFSLRSQRRKELQDQLDACTLVAERPGLVVYAGSDEPWRNRGQIEEGAAVYERQEIITIPDMTRMAVRVKIHESNIKKLQVGQKATVKLESYPDEELTGEVIKLSVIPDSSSRWMNPDMKLYPATVAINGTYDWMKPGMTASVDIVVKDLKDVVYVPIQAIIPKDGKRYCYVVDTFGGRQERVVQTGDSNNEFIEVVSGLKEGERVMLRAPEAASGGEEKSGDKEKDKGKDGKDNKGEPGKEQRPPRDAAPPQGNGGGGPKA